MKMHYYKWPALGGRCAALPEPYSPEAMGEGRMIEISKEEFEEDAAARAGTPLEGLRLPASGRPPASGRS